MAFSERGSGEQPVFPNIPDAKLSAIFDSMVLNPARLYV
jgi:hypothetical protein